LLGADGGAPGSLDAGIEGRVDATAVGPGADGSAPRFDALSPDTGQGYCSGSGPPALLMTNAAGTTTSTCPDQLAQRAFRYALCVCQNYTSDHALVTDAFDGTQGPYDPSTAMAGGSVGVNGQFHPGPITIKGSVWASGAFSSITTTSPIQIAGELHAQGELQPSATVTVQGDAWMANGIQTGGSGPVNVTVGGTLHLPAGALDSVSGTFTHGPFDNSAFPNPMCATPVQPDSGTKTCPACDCDPSQFVDVAGVVRTYETQNDDGALQIDEHLLENPQTGVTRTLQCGLIYFTYVGGTAPIHLTTAGRVAIFINGDLTSSDFEIEVPGGTELDLFVAGNITAGTFKVGDQRNPARARTYVGGSVNLQGATTLAGNLYVPNATITLGNTAPTFLYGSIFASGLNAGSDLTIHYDEAILTPSSTPSCATPSTCNTCNDCNGQACNSGTCGHCADSTQCCAPLVCTGGTCVADVIPR
jgi:hypothetical protein